MKDFRIDQIKFGVRIRRLRPEKVNALACSIEMGRLINPITITSSGELISGYHRLEACRQLGKEVIPVIEMDISGPKARLMEIDENLVRSELTVLEKGESILFRKQAYEEMYPETKHGGDRRSEELKSSPHGDDLKRFTLDTAEKMGASESTVQRLARIAAKIDPEVKELIWNTWVENSPRALLILSDQRPQQQKEVAQKLLARDSRSVNEVMEQMVKEDQAIRNPKKKAAATKDPPEQPVVEAPVAAPEAGSPVDVKEKDEIASDGGADTGTPPASEPEVEKGLTTDSQDLPVNEDSGSPEKGQEGPDKPEEDKGKEQMPEWIQRLLDAAKDDHKWDYILLVRKGEGLLKRDWQRNIMNGYHVKAGIYRDTNREEEQLTFVTTDHSGITPKISCIITKSGTVAIWAVHQKENWDILSEFDIYEQRNEYGQYFCQLCEPPEMFTSRKELWVKHSFEPLLEWCNEHLQRSKILFFLGREGHYSYADIKRHEELSKMKAAKDFVYACPVVLRDASVREIN